MLKYSNILFLISAALLGFEVDLVDVRDVDEKTQLLAASLQGNINRAAPRIFLLWGESWYPSYDSIWINFYAEKGWVTYTEISLDSALSKYSPELSGFIVYDPDFRHSINIATTMAGLDDGLIAHPDLIGYLQGFGLSMLRDLRGMWPDSIKAYQWQYDSLYANCNKDMIGHALIVDESSTTHSMRDLLIMNRAATISLFYVPGDTASYLIRAYYEELNPLGLVLGWPIDSTELAYVHLTSQHQLMVVPCREFSQNFSIHSQIPAETTYTQTHIDSVVIDTSKVYCSFLMVDGGFDMLGSRYYLAWDDPARGTIPVNWYISPVQKDFCPGICQHYYETKTPKDYFIAGFGLGYIYPSDLPDLNSYLERSQGYLTACDIKIIALVNLFRMDEHVVNAYTLTLNNCIGFMQGYGPYGFRPGNYRFTNDKPWIITAAFAWADSSLAIAQAAIEKFVADRPERPLFCPVWVNLFGVFNVDSVRTLMNNLELNNPGTYKFVKLDEFLLAVKKYAAFFDSSNYRPDTFNIFYGSLIQGGLTDLYFDDGNYLIINSEWTGSEYSTGFYADYHINEQPSKVRRIKVTFDGHFSNPSNNSLWLWDYKNSEWEFIGWRNIGTIDWTQHDGVVYNAADFVSSDSIVRVAVIGTGDNPFLSYADLLRLRVFYGPVVDIQEKKPYSPINSIELYQNSPNPFNLKTSIRYSITRNCHVELKVYNIAGQVVRTLVDEQKKVGIHTVSWDGCDDQRKPVASGVYFCTLKAGNSVKTRKLLLLR